MPYAKALTLCFVLSWGALPVNPADHPPEEERKSIPKRLVGKGALIRAGAGTAWGFARNSPHEWGRTAAGAGKRFGSAMGKHAVGSLVQLGVSTWRHEDLSYSPSEETGFKNRLRHALVSTVVARKKTTGQPTMAAGRVSGAVASGFISRLWQPARLHTFANGLSTSGISLGVDAGMHVARKFWPEIRHPRRAAQSRQ